MKSLYRHKQSGDLFAIETDEAGHVRSTSGPLFSDDLDPKLLDYDEYWNTEVQAKLDDFIRITKADYKEILRQNRCFISLTVSEITSASAVKRHSSRPS